MTPDTRELAFAAELCHVRPAVTSREGLLRLLGGTAVAGGYAKPTLVQALLDREERFPTGLPTPMPSAIPHADVVHVARPALSAALLSSPLSFGELGGSERTVDVEIVVLLLVDDPATQVDALSRLLTVLRAVDLRDRLHPVDAPARLAAVLNEALGSERPSQLSGRTP